MSREQASVMHGIRYHIDTASEASIEGWALGPNGVCEVEVLVDGRVVGRARTGLPRPDVAAALPGIPDSEQSGFAYTFGPDDFDDPVADRAQLAVRLAADGHVLESEPVEIPRLRPAREITTLPRSPFPPSITALLLRASAAFWSERDLSPEATCLEAIDLLSWLVQRGPRPLDGLHRYLAYLRSVENHADFVERYFPRANPRPGSERDLTCALTSARELLSIAHHLYVVADAGVPGGLLEFGCYKGFSTSVLSFACRQLDRPMEVFDSFAGLPASESSYYQTGDFAGSLPEVTRHVTAFGAIERVSFHEGFFSETVPRWSKQPIACLWMDVDLERSARDALAVFDNLDVRAALFSHECRPHHFQGHRIVTQRGADSVLGPIVDAFTHAGRTPVGIFLAGHTGAFWDEESGIPVLPSDALVRLLALARR